jgi:uncharacterized membrane protein
MNPENVNPENSNSDPVQPESNETVPVENVREAAPAERWAESAKEQAADAAGAFRRGEFMQDESVDPDANSDDKLIALLCYITQIFVPVVMPLIVLFSESSKKRPFQRYHAVQSLALAIAIVLILGVMSIGGGIIFIIPILGWIIGGLLLCLTPIVALMAVVAALYYGFQAYQGKRFAIPGLTSLLQDQGWI